MLRTVLLSLSLLLGGLIASVGTLFIPKTIHSQAELAAVPMGWPLPFVRQDLSGYTPMSWPQVFAFAQPQDNPVTVHMVWLAANTLVLSAIVLLVYMSITRFLRAVTTQSRRRLG
jgi:hypothetical protein